MKKTIYHLFIIVAIIAVSLSANPPVINAATQAVSVTFNGVKISFPDAQPFIDKQGRVQVPVRYIGNALQVNVDYATKNSSRTAVFFNKSTKVEFVLNTSAYYVNDVKLEMDTKSQVLQNRTYTPARYLAEQFGANVKWIPSTRTVEIIQSELSKTIPTTPPVLSTTTLTGQLKYESDESALQMYHALAVSLLKTNANYMSNRDQAIKQFETIITPVLPDKAEKATAIAAYKLKSTANDYRWKSEDIKAFSSALQALSTNDKLTTQVFDDNTEKVLSYRHIVNVNSVPIWLEVQFTFKQVNGANYRLVDIKA